MKYNPNRVYSYLCFQMSYCALLRKHDCSKSRWYLMQVYLRRATPKLLPDTDMYLLIRSELLCTRDLTGTRDTHTHISRLHLLNIERGETFNVLIQAPRYEDIWCNAFVNSALEAGLHELHAPAAFPRVKSPQWPSDGRLDEPQSQSGRGQE
jgi:hypothetical protein